ncbi:hypothetical protein [Romboutsia sp.]|uniref:hypothetical protein n=1 Tax=Romboutsia sp. TaxID=1965302 RepID=UPI003F2B3ED8
MINKYKPKSLQNKLLYRFLFVLIVLLITLGFYQYTNMKNYLYQSRIEFFDSRFKNIDKDIILRTTNEELLNENMQQILDDISTEEVCVAIINQKEDSLKNLLPHSYCYGLLKHNHSPSL